MQTDAARVLLDAYWQNPANAEVALNTLKNGSQFKDVKLFIDEELKCVEADNAEGTDGSEAAKEQQQ